jgi:hypothetical protein
MSPRRIPVILSAALRVFAFLGAAIFTTATSHAADAPPWQIISASGSVAVHRAGATPIALKADDSLAPGDRLETGPDARLVLRRGADTIVVAPNSSVAIPPEQRGGVTTLLQAMGTLLVKVERRATPNFEVRTPYLTAVVKGTSFAVSVDASGAGVHVLEGQVQVSDPGGAQSALLAPGSTARVGATPGRPMQLDGPARRVEAQPAVASAAVARIEATSAAPRIAQPIALAAVDIDRNSRGLVVGERGRSVEARGGARDAKGEAKGEAAEAGRPGRAVLAAGFNGGYGNAFGNAFAGPGNNGNGNAFAGAGNNGNGNGLIGGNGKSKKKK